MGRTVFCVENFFNVKGQFPSHVVSANEAAAGHPAWMVGMGRRSADRNSWMSITANQAAWLKVKCDRIREGRYLFLDRGHNLSGETLILEGSNNDFTTTTQVFSLTVPSYVFPNSRFAQSPGVLTEEAAWGFMFPGHSFRYWRLNIPAMGVGEIPRIVGAYLGGTFRPSHAQVLPFDFGQRELMKKETISPTAWVGALDVAQRKRGSIHLKLEPGGQEYDEARYHIEELFLRNKPMWIVQDDEQAEKSVLAIPPAGTAGFQKERDWSEFQGRIPWVEHDPKLT